MKNLILLFITIMMTTAAFGKQKIMITGHKGYVGKELVEVLGNDYEIVGYDLLDGDDIPDYDNLVKNERMRICNP